MLATDLADYLVRKGVPFRKAHHAVGAAVALAEQKAKRLDALTVEELQSVDGCFSEDALEIFRLDKALDKRITAGGPAPSMVRKQLETWKRMLK